MNVQCLCVSAWLVATGVCALSVAGDSGATTQSERILTAFPGAEGFGAQSLGGA